MMNSGKRRRGRPPGAGARKDLPRLRMVADRMAADPKLRVTTAIKRVVADVGLIAGDTEVATVVRRLQGKWQKDGDRLLSEARQRRSARMERTDYIPVTSVFVRQEARIFGNSPLAKAIEDATRTARDLDEIVRPFREALQRENTTVRVMQKIMADAMERDRAIQEVQASFRSFGELHRRLALLGLPGSRTL